MASDNGDIKILEFLMEKGVNIHTPADNGATPLIVTVSKGHFHACKLLIEHGADIHSPLSDGAVKK